MHILKETLEALRKLSTPTVSNAIELFNLRPRNEGYLSPDIRCLFPELGVMVGRAVTLRFAAEQQAAEPGSRYESWKYMLEAPEPRVLVLQDLNQRHGRASFLGDV